MADILIESVRGIANMPIDSVFLKDRKVFLVGEVTDSVCNNLIKELLYLEAEDNTKPITLYINSPGGDVISGLGVFDTIRLLSSPVRTVVTGEAASMGSIIMLAAEKENRFILPNSKVMIHDCSWSRRDMGGKKPFQIEEELSELKRMNEKLLDIIAQRCGRTVEEVAEQTKDDHFFDAEEAVAFGLAGSILDRDSFGILTTKGE